MKIEWELFTNELVKKKIGYDAGNYTKIDYQQCVISNHSSSI